VKVIKNFFGAHECFQPIDKDSLSLQTESASFLVLMETLVGAEPPLKQLATDLVAHFEQRSRTQPSKAIVVAKKKESSDAAF
jgi:type I restriction enzyme R subunit